MILLFFFLCAALTSNIPISAVTIKENAFTQENLCSTENHKTFENSDEMIEHFKNEISMLNKTHNLPRDKRALGIILRGFLQALGFTVSPVQVASLPNPMAQTGTPASPRMPATMPPQQRRAMNMSSMTPRQRETLRFTGVVNFGNNLNTSNLINHLAQYEQIFHGNATSTPAPPPPPPPPSTNPVPSIDPRGQYPYLIPLPLPISPNQNSESEEYVPNDENSGERDVACNDEEEEEDKSHYSEEDENKQEQQNDEPEDRNDEMDSGSGGRIDEHEYKRNRNMEKYSIESKEIHDPSEVSRSRYNHAMYVDEPDWKQKQEAYVYKLAAEQEARAEALAEENAEREKEVEGAGDNIEDRDGNTDEDDSEERTYHSEDDEEESEERNEYTQPQRHREQHDYEEETRVHKESRLPSLEEKRYRESTNVENSRKSASNKNKYDQELKHKDEARKNLAKYYTALPLSYGYENSNRDNILRDSYGEILEKPGGKVDERIASYITMFKNPKTGVYDPNRHQEHLQLILDPAESVIKNIKPAYKYEEYEIENNLKSVRRRPVKVQEQRKYENMQSRKISKKPALVKSKSTKSNNKPSLQFQNSRSLEQSIKLTSGTTSLPLGSASYYSTVKHIYQPNFDHGIIASLTSYDSPTTAKFNDSKDNSRNPKEVVPRERPAAKSLLQEAEAKEIRAWPAPFDYAFDNSEDKPVVRAASNKQMNQTRYQKDKNANRKAQSILPANYRDEVQVFFNTRERDNDERKNFQRQSGGSRGSKSIKYDGQPPMRVRQQKYLQSSSPTINDNHRRPPSVRKSKDYYEETTLPTQAPFTYTYFKK